MSWPFISRLALGLGFIASGAQPAESQRPDALSIGFRKPAPTVVASAPVVAPSLFSLGNESVKSGLTVALLAGTAGFLVDYLYCSQHYGDERSVLFRRCTAYTGIGTAGGWFGGAALGATLGAARMARKRGCPSGAALMRAIAGAVLGAASGLSIVTRRPGKYPPAHTALIVGTPLLAGVGAAAAVVGCQGP